MHYADQPLIGSLPAGSRTVPAVAIHSENHLHHGFEMQNHPTLSTVNGQSNSPFCRHADSLLAIGLMPIPIVAGEKRPGIVGARSGASWQLATPSDTAKLDEWKRGAALFNAGIGVRTGFSGLIGLDLDTTRQELIDDFVAACQRAGGVYCAKTGSKGVTVFFRRGDHPVTSIRLEGSNAPGEGCDVLFEGRQAVLPPARHPDGMEYRWTGFLPLYNLELGDLPELTGMVMADVEALLAKHLGKPRRIERADRGAGSGSDSFASLLNRVALDNLDLWVPGLPLYGLERKRTGGWHAVNSMRASGTGRAMADRARNLGISPNGIRDFGTSATWQPAGLVAEAFGIGFGQALTWLCKQLAGPMAVELPAFSGLVK